MDKRLLELNKRIAAHINNGGSIYDPKRELPYYDYLSEIVKSLKKSTGQDVTYADVYKMCGIKFDRDYNSFMEFLAELKKYSGPNKYVDRIKTNEVRKKSNVYERLKNYADKFNTTPFDFLTLMTEFRFSECIVHTNDYVGLVQKEIKKAFPSGDLTGIKSTRNDLYEKLRHILKYSPEYSSMQDLVTTLGFTMDGASYCPPNTPSKSMVIQELTELFPTGVITKLKETNAKLHHYVILLSRKENKSTTQWYAENGFSYPETQSHPRLGQIKVDGNEREALLLKLKAQALSDYDLQNADEIDLFRFSLEASKRVIGYLSTQSLVPENPELIDQRNQ